MPSAYLASPQLYYKYCAPGTVLYKSLEVTDLSRLKNHALLPPSNC